MAAMWAASFTAWHLRPPEGPGLFVSASLPQEGAEEEEEVEEEEEGGVHMNEPPPPPPFPQP